MVEKKKRSFYIFPEEIALRVRNMKREEIRKILERSQQLHGVRLKLFKSELKGLTNDPYYCSCLGIRGRYYETLERKKDRDKIKVFAYLSLENIERFYISQLERLVFIN